MDNQKYWDYVFWVRKNEIEILEKKVKEKDMIIKMERVVKIFKNKLLLSLSKGFKIKVDKNSYMSFKTEEDYDILFYLERVFFDLYKNLLFNDDEIIRVFFRLSLIKILLEKLTRIKFKIFYDKSKYENPFRIKFPNLSYLDYNYYKEMDNDIQGNLSDEIVEKIRDNFGKIGNLYYEVVYKLYTKINIKYYKL